ncbi:MAG TPA: DUF423 domain-containing protein [Chitinophagaceae bacterium]|nr:DUF423 domain-containing protein [Chitinophagaceae bacterium]
MHKKFLAIGAGLSGLAVAAGAFGAHGLQKLTSDSKILQTYQTGVQYQGWHALALILVAILFSGTGNQKLLKYTGYCFLMGILLFSGSLYLLTLLKINESGMSRVIGPITPIGGLFFIGGWILLLLAVLKKEKS